MCVVCKAIVIPGLKGDVSKILQRVVILNTADLRIVAAKVIRMSTIFKETLEEKKSSMPPKIVSLIEKRLFLLSETISFCLSLRLNLRHIKNKSAKETMDMRLVVMPHPPYAVFESELADIIPKEALDRMFSEVNDKMAVDRLLKDVSGDEQVDGAYHHLSDTFSPWHKDKGLEESDIREQIASHFSSEEPEHFGYLVSPDYDEVDEHVGMTLNFKEDDPTEDVNMKKESLDWLFDDTGDEPSDDDPDDFLRDL